MRKCGLQLLTPLLLFALTFATECPSLYQQNNFVLRNNILASLLVPNEKECTKKCTSNMDCFSVNYYKKKKLCELNKATHLSSPVDLVYDEEGTYIKLKQQDVCSDKYCNAGKKCFVDKISHEYVCDECPPYALGMSSGKIPDSAITASSMYNSGHAPSMARLHNYPAMPYNQNVDSAAWSARYNRAGEYLQVDLVAMKYVTMVATQGRPYYSSPQYVTKYKLSYKNSNNIFVEYRVDNEVKVFQANTDVNTVVTHRLPEKIKTQFIRFVVVQWVTHISMRAEIYGCSAQ